MTTGQRRCLRSVSGSDPPLPGERRPENVLGDRNSFHPEEFGWERLAPGQSLDSAKRTQQVTVFSMNQI